MTPPSTALRPAAVLVPLIDRPEGMSVLLTQRTAHLTAHAGQISFPGGRIEESDTGRSVASKRRYPTENAAKLAAFDGMIFLKMKRGWELN